MTKDHKDPDQHILEALWYGSAISIIGIPYRDFYPVPRKLPREHTEIFCGVIYLGQPDEIISADNRS